MSDEPDRPRLTRYLVELERPSDGWGELSLVTARARAEADELTAEGVDVRFLRSIFVPEDESCFFLYEAGSVEAVGEAGRRAQLAVTRIDESVRIPQQAGGVRNDAQPGHAVGGSIRRSPNEA